MAGPDLSLITSLSSELSGLVVPLMSVFAAYVVVLVVAKGIKMVVWSVRGNKIEYGGKSWDKDVWESAIKEVRLAQRSGMRIDRESKRALKNDGKLF